jgi:signal peptidase I
VVPHWTIASLAGLALVLAAPLLAYAVPELVGADQARVVQSGSMEPSIPTGSIVYVDTSVAIDEIEEGDVVTFRVHPTSTQTYTHRVVDVTENMGGTVLETKGDANDQPDAVRTDDAMLVGRVAQDAPAYGYLVAYLDRAVSPLWLVGLSLVTIGNELRGLLGGDEATQFTPVDAEPTRFSIVDAETEETP